MKVNKNSKVNIFLSRDRNVLVVSFFISLILWIIISFDTDAKYTTTINSIPISVNTSIFSENSNGYNYSLYNSSGIASVDITGRRELIKTITKDDIIVLADIKDINSTGTFEVNLSAVDLKGKDYIISNIRPSSVKIIVTKK